GIEAVFTECVEQLLGAIPLFPCAVASLQPPLERVAAVGRSEDCSAEVGDAAHFVGSERHQLAFAQQAAESPLDPHAFPAAMHRAEHGGANDGVQAGRVAAARGDCEPHFLPGVPWRINRTTSPGSAWRLVLFLE